MNAGDIDLWVNEAFAVVPMRIMDHLISITHSGKCQRGADSDGASLGQQAV
jgi:hypothetical protein